MQVEIEESLADLRAGLANVVNGQIRLTADEATHVAATLEETRDAYLAAQNPRNEVAQQALQRQRQLIGAVLGLNPADVNVDTMFDTARETLRQLHDAARVPSGGDLVTEVRAGAEARGGSEFGVNSRFGQLQAERDRIQASWGTLRDQFDRIEVAQAQLGSENESLRQQATLAIDGQQQAVQSLANVKQVVGRLLVDPETQLSTLTEQQREQILGA